MSRLSYSSNITILNFLVVSYFAILWAFGYYGITSAIINFLRELLTIPFLAAEVVLLVVGIRYLFKPNKELLVIISIAALAVCTFLTIGSFF